MKKRTLAGIICGLIYGVVIFWGAMYPALPAGGLIALAAGLVGFMGAIGGGGLIGLTVAIGVEEEEEREIVTRREPEIRAAA
jgi:hypothetical protein